ncbi:hypothetical protein BU24DRAFT_241099 [Aaosphaeria arxii CBS 175.79]|uniref:Uncharacterized protein n=1 Tax=Aaosphaeria arxii CBS 175.79 TaxID=1450172 RepID=A0A6A5XK26_9PLEO|nr:uncharacterized protein BU24DRAFT_241099 [Aaosphaeria arxii CBS 175.79]KAF2013605.1 hypothetical protein BU24DRAFT_241099 [Aaosphaeria arxii CBS 175.79]
MVHACQRAGDSKEHQMEYPTVPWKLSGLCFKDTKFRKTNTFETEPNMEHGSSRVFVSMIQNFENRHFRNRTWHRAWKLSGLCFNDTEFRKQTLSKQDLAMFPLLPTANDAGQACMVEPDWSSNIQDKPVIATMSLSAPIMGSNPIVCDCLGAGANVELSSACYGYDLSVAEFSHMRNTTIGFLLQKFTGTTSMKTLDLRLEKMSYSAAPTNVSLCVHNMPNEPKKNAPANKFQISCLGLITNFLFLLHSFV